MYTLGVLVDFLFWRLEHHCENVDTININEVLDEEH